MNTQRSPDDQLLELVGLPRRFPEWRASSVTMAVPGQVMTSAGVSWLVHFHVYGVRRRLTRASTVELTCGFTVGSKKPRLTPNERVRLRRTRWFSNVRHGFSRLG